jgi:hypothetical protein
MDTQAHYTFTDQATHRARAEAQDQSPANKNETHSQVVNGCACLVVLLAGTRRIKVVTPELKHNSDIVGLDFIPSSARMTFGTSLYETYTPCRIVATLRIVECRCQSGGLQIVKERCQINTPYQRRNIRDAARNDCSQF